MTNGIVAGTTLSGVAADIATLNQNLCGVNGVCCSTNNCNSSEKILLSSWLYFIYVLVNI